MSSEYDENKSGNANSSGSRGDPDIRKRANRNLQKEFNVEVELGERFASLSPEGRKNIEILAQHGNDRLEREINDQRRSHSYRKVVEENRRLKELVRHPDLKLGEVKLDGQSEIKHIEDIAKETLSRREQTYRDNIKEEIRFSIEREIADDRKRRERGPDYDLSRDDPERER